MEEFNNLLNDMDLGYGSGTEFSFNEDDDQYEEMEIDAELEFEVDAIAYINQPKDKADEMAASLTQSAV